MMLQVKNTTNSTTTLCYVTWSQVQERSTENPCMSVQEMSTENPYMSVRQGVQMWCLAEMTFSIGLKLRLQLPVLFYQIKLFERAFRRLHPHKKTKFKNIFKEGLASTLLISLKFKIKLVMEKDLLRSKSTVKPGCLITHSLL